MTKTLKCNINNNPWTAPKYVTITATKIDEIETNVKNLYEDEKGNKYIVQYNKFQKRDEFIQL